MIMPLICNWRFLCVAAPLDQLTRTASWRARLWSERCGTGF